MAKKTKDQIIDEASQAAEESAKDFLGDSYIAPEKRQRPANLETVSSGAGYFDFKKDPIFVGSYVSDFLAPKDIQQGGDKVTKKGEVIGYNFIEIGEDHQPTGMECIISNSYAITEALKNDKFSKVTVWWIEFQGKKTVKGRPFNSFYIGKVK